MGEHSNSVEGRRVVAEPLARIEQHVSTRGVAVRPDVERGFAQQDPFRAAPGKHVHPASRRGIGGLVWVLPGSLRDGGDGEGACGGVSDAGLTRTMA